VGEALTTWLLLDVSTMAVIQGAVWSVFAVQFNSTAATLRTPAAFAALASPTYSSHVAAFDAISFAMKLEDFLLGISFLLLGFKLFKLFTLYPNLSLAYSIIVLTAWEVLSWTALTLSIFLFFAVGGTYLFGSNIAQFSDVGNALISTILYCSKVVLPLGAHFDLEQPVTDRSTSALLTLSQPYSTAPIFSLSLWLGLMAVFVFWMLRNILLGIVISGFDRLWIENEALEFERRERNEVFAQEPGQLKRLGRFTKRMWFHYTLQKLEQRLATDARLVSRGFATESEMRGLVLDAAAPRVAEQLMPLLAVFRVELKRLDEALALVLMIESPGVNGGGGTSRTGSSSGAKPEEDDGSEAGTGPAAANSTLDEFDMFADDERIVDDDSALLTTLSFVLGLKSQATAQDVSDGIANIDGLQRHILKALAGLRSPGNPWLDNRGKHGIERQADGTYKVHHTTAAGAYRYVGDFAGISEAEGAFALAEDTARQGPRGALAGEMAGEEEADEEDDASLGPGDVAAKSKRINVVAEHRVASMQRQSAASAQAGSDGMLLRLSGLASRAGSSVSDALWQLWGFVRGAGGDRETLYMDSKGVWCDARGVQVHVKMPMSVLPLAKLRYDKAKMA
jgi:hypothetical protein